MFEWPISCMSDFFKIHIRMTFVSFIMILIHFRRFSLVIFNKYGFISAYKTEKVRKFLSCSNRLKNYRVGLENVFKVEEGSTEPKYFRCGMFRLFMND